jgi:hypothetical protein
LLKSGDPKKFFNPSTIFPVSGCSLLLAGASILAKLSIEMLDHLAGYLSWRDLCAVLVGANLDIRPCLSAKNFKRCVLNNNIDPNSKLKELCRDLLNFSFLRTCEPHVFLEEYLWIGLRLRSTHKTLAFHRYAVNIDSCSLLITKITKAEFHFKSIRQTCFHPKKRVVAFVLVQEREEGSVTKTECFLMIKHFEKAGRGGSSSSMVFLSDDKTSTEKMHTDGELRCSWSPCGDFLSTVESSAVLSGPRAQSKIQIFAYDSEQGLLKNIGSINIVVNSRSVSTNLWIGPGKMILPDPLDRGDEPSVLVLSKKDRHVQLLRPDAAEGQKFYNYLSGMLTGFANGMAGFVTACHKAADTVGDRAKCYLSEHDHHQVVVLDDRQKRMAEIDIPGIVLQLCERGGKIGVLYRENVGALFTTSHAKIRAPSCAHREAFVPKFARSPVRSTASSVQLSYHSYPRYSQSARRMWPAAEKAARERLGSPCALELYHRVPEGKLPRRASCGITGLSHKRPRYESRMRLTPSSSDSDDDDDDPTTDDDVDNVRSMDTGGEAASTAAAASSSDSDHDFTCKGTWSHPVVTRQTHHYYAEFDPVSHQRTFFSETKLWRDGSCLAPAYEVRCGDLGNPTANQNTVLCRYGPMQAIDVTDSVVLVKTGSLYPDEHGTTLMLRNHDNLPGFSDPEYRTLQLDSNSLRYTRTYGGFGTMSDSATILSLMSGRDSSETDLGYRINKAADYTFAEGVKAT